MFYFQAQYSTMQDFTISGLESAKNARINMIKKIKKQIENNKLEY
jgi:hypothetical protein